MLDFGFYNMDCMQGMKEFPDKFFELAIVDPPYGLLDAGMQTGGCQGIFKHRIYRNGAIKDWDFAPPPEYFEELFRVSKNQIIWGGNYFSLPPCRCFVVWDKLQPFETFSRCEFAWTSFKSPAKLFQFDNRYAGKIHPTQKPVELYEWLIAKYAKDGDKILDTHAGSGSCLIACRNTNHKYVGFEINPDFYAKAKARVDAEAAQMNIYDFLGGTEQ